jgi:hypothetical protein
MENTEAKLLKFIEQQEFAKEEIIIKKFGEIRLRDASAKMYVFEKPGEQKVKWFDEMIPSKSGLYGLTEIGEKALEDYKSLKKEEWLKFWIPVAISIIALAISFVALLAPFASRASFC